MVGRPPSVDDETVIRAVALHPEPVVAPKDVHGELDLSKAGARERMKRLNEKGLLKSKTVGSSGLVFWISDDGRDLLQNI